MSPTAYSGALEAIDRILNRGGETDDVLRAVVIVLRERFGREVEIRFAHGEGLAPRSEAGTGDPAAPRSSFPVPFEGTRVAELAVAWEPDADGRAFLERVATVIAAYCRRPPATTG